MKRILYPGIALVLLVVTVAQVRATRNDAPAPAPARPASEQLKVSAEGRLVAYPGAEVTISSDVAGTLVELLVREKDEVRRGDVIAVIRADETRAELNESRSRVNEAEADIRLFQAESARAKHLWEGEVGSKQAWEKSERDIDAARARRTSALAAVTRLEALVAKTVIKAPLTGTVVARLVDAGERVGDGEALITVADLTRTRVEAEVDEFDVARIRLGAPVTVVAEGFEKGWSGTVEEIPDAVIGRRLKPQDPSKPIDTRVLLVKVALLERSPLKLGQRVEVQIAVK